MELRSERGTVFVQDGFIYVVNRVAGGRKYMKCLVSTCQCRGKLIEDEIILSGFHNHPSNEVSIEVRLFKIALKEAAFKEVDKKPKKIYQEVSKR